MTKDKIIGAVIMILAILLIIVYTVIGPIDLLLADPIPAGWEWLDTITAWIRNIPGMNYLWAMMLPLFLVVFLVGVIAAWIGFSMLTTPPPVPLEELEEELEAEEAEEDKGSE